MGTDGSDTATQAVRQAVDLAKAVGATLELVSAYEPVPAQRLAQERREAPEDLQWAINLASKVGARLLIVSAYEPVSELRLREERQSAPSDAQWMVSPREDV
ncbi:MAG TPA: universal stress protein, partial [Solirubrobacteraceae bacterium]